MYIKRFNQWNKVKKKINYKKSRLCIRKGEIRWAIFGVNVGSEMDGKGINFTRPVLIIDMIGANLALVVPLSSNLKITPGRLFLKWKGNVNSLCINQIRILSTKRVLGRKCLISEKKLADVKNKIKLFYSL